MPHWESLRIERFRNLEALDLADFGTVNLLMGRNNSGKTAVLESLALICHPLSPSNWLQVARERSHEGETLRPPALLPRLFSNTSSALKNPDSAPHPIAFTAQLQKSKRIFRNLDAPDDIFIRASIAQNEATAVAIEPSRKPRGSSRRKTSDGSVELNLSLEREAPDGTQTNSGPISCVFHDGHPPVEPGGEPILPHQYVSPNSHRTLEHLRKALQVEGDPSGKQRILEMLQRFAVNAEDLRLVKRGGERESIEVLYPGKLPVPLADEGNGMRRAATLAAAAILAQGGVLLVDEIETSLHLEALADVLPLLVQICDESKVQLFLTTQSLEVVDAMLAIMGCATDDSDDLVAFRLPGRESNYPLKRYPGKTLYELRYDAGLDVR